MNLSSKKNVAREIKAFLNDTGIAVYAAFIGGSFFFSSKTDWDRFSNGKSDIDTVVVCKDYSQSKSALLRLFPPSILEGFLRGEYSILNHAHRYGSGRNVLHIKFMSYDLFESLATLSAVSFLSFRKESLAQRKSSASFASNGADVSNFRYLEEKVDGGYLLRYQFNPVQDGEFFLSDIHSMVLLSICIHDTIEARTSRSILLSNIRNYLKDSASEEAVMQTFRYFSEKDLITEHWKDRLLGYFWMDTYQAADLYFQDSL